MKIEKINDNKIKCTLTRSDLESRKIHLDELAYGSDKAKQLFQDMMQQAHNRFGFDTDNSPLMIEAIPTSTDSITLIITKVDDPEELDTRFSRFSPSEEDTPAEPKQPSSADSILDLFKKIRDAHKDREDTQEESKEDPAKAKVSRSATPSEGSQGKAKEATLLQAFSFTNLDCLIQAAHSLQGFYDGLNTLFKEGDEFMLILHMTETSPERFNQVCNILTEYGTNRQCTKSFEAHLLEHSDMILKNHALQDLARY